LDRVPTQPQINRDGTAKLDAGGKPLWAQTVDLRDRAPAEQQTACASSFSMRFVGNTPGLAAYER
jgi:hypothetical protein